VTVFAIRNARDHKRALREIETLMDARRGTPEGDRLDILATLVEAYEATQDSMPLPDPIEAIRFDMEQNGLAAVDLVPFIGRRNRVYEVLRRRRPLTLRMAWQLHSGLGIPAESPIRAGEMRTTQRHVKLAAEYVAKP
jgi:HTH-type transcriptional regulator / antitoxin HigA